MRIKLTASYPLEEVKALCKVASYGIRTKNFRIWIKNSRYAFAGRAWSSYAVVRIGKPHHYPIKDHQYTRLKTAPVYDINDWKEAMIIVVAHELRHLQQGRLRMRGKGEVDAERWALKRLHAYRASL